MSYQGEQFIRRFDANSYLYITKAIDYFDIGADYGSLRKAVQRTQATFLVASFTSDWLYPAEQGLELVRALEAVGRPVQFHLIDAPFGHDSFLVEVDRVASVVGTFLKEQSEARV